MSQPLTSLLIVQCGVVSLRAPVVCCAGWRLASLSLDFDNRGKYLIGGFVLSLNCSRQRKWGNFVYLPPFGNPSVPKKNNSQGNKNRKNKYNREKRALKRRNVKWEKGQQAVEPTLEEWQAHVVLVLEESPVPLTDFNESSCKRERTRYNETVQPWGIIVENPHVGKQVNLLLQVLLPNRHGKL